MESTSTDVAEGIHDALKQTRGVQKVNEVLTLHMGPDYILVILDVGFADHIGAGKLKPYIKT